MKNERTREILALGILGLASFLAAAMVSYSDSLPSGESSGRSNVCGVVGCGVARFLFHYFGWPAYLLVLALVLEALRLWVVAEYRSFYEKLPGLLLFLVVCSATLSRLFPGWSQSIPDPGGDVGLVLNRVLFDYSGLGPLGASLVLAFLFLTTFVLFSDLLVSNALQAAVRWFRNQRGARSGSAWLRFTARPVQRSLAKPPYSPAGEPDYSAVDSDDDSDPKRTRPASPESGRELGRNAQEGKPASSVRASMDEVEADSTTEELDDFELDAREDGNLDDVEELVEGDSGDAAADRNGKDDSVEQRRESSLRRLLQNLRERGKETAATQASAVAASEGRRESTPQAGKEEVEDPDLPYVSPGLDLLMAPTPVDGGDLEKFTVENARKLTQVLQSFKLEATVVGVQRGPTITMLEVELAPGTKLGRLRSLEDDLAMNLAARTVRIVAPIPGKSTAGIEIPNDVMETVRLSDLITSTAYTRRVEKFGIPLFLGKDSSGAPRIEDLAQMPHLLVAGSTGAGKSVCLNTLIMSILYTRTPDQVQLILIDPKMVELSLFQNVPHLMCPVVTDMKKAAAILEWAVDKMESRYQLMHEVGVRNIHAYNKLGEERIKETLGGEFGEDLEATLPFIVLVIDELADLMLVSAKDVEQSITRLAQKSRAVGIHVILATQRPSTNVITGLIKANLPTRIAFRVASKIDSRVILDVNGAEKLLGAGDMLYLPPRSAEIVRVQGSFVEDLEIKNTVEFLAQQGKPRYSQELLQQRAKNGSDPFEIDDLFEDATRYVVETQRGSASLLQRRFAIGYTRASRLIDLMATEGVLGDYKGSQAREVLMHVEDFNAYAGQRKGAALAVEPQDGSDLANGPHPVT